MYVIIDIRNERLLSWFKYDYVFIYIGEFCNKIININYI